MANINNKHVFYQQTYKNVLIQNDVLRFLIQLIEEPLCLDIELIAMCLDRTELQNDTLELFLCLFKNILAIPNPPIQSIENPSNLLFYLHDRAILAFVQVLLFVYFFVYLRLNKRVCVCVNSWTGGDYGHCDGNVSQCQRRNEANQHFIGRYHLPLFPIGGSNSFFLFIICVFVLVGMTMVIHVLGKTAEKVRRQQHFRRTRHNKWNSVCRVTTIVSFESIKQRREQSTKIFKVNQKKKKKIKKKRVE
ncbi:hypothetical protein RFI_28198 [Reticulomyxa filosa]|uniref:Timeless N-terminal domain-containing protein n=1 Tax=Reticulomyxa filosa TaxID=46433 RepID=X6M6U5_RETFI|nr:hypothetical protein RFI_28198 [Reticulomyxa filosa]|eukprot:ETO09187.1 hypothetical protein RFI_28198 [Reticulomyxa filosa]